MAAIYVKYTIQCEVRYDVKYDEPNGKDIVYWATDENAIADMASDLMHEGNFVVKNVSIGYDPQEIIE